MAAIDNLRSALTLATASYSSLVANPKPNYTIDGESYSYNDLRKSLLEEIETLQEAIAQLEGPFEVLGLAE